MENPKPTTEHQWLQQLVGQWTYSTEHEGHVHRGTETIRPIGDIWIQGEARGEMTPGQVDTMIVTLGFDPKRGKFVGSWIGSMMAGMWVYEGALDDARTTLTLDCEGPSFTDPTKTAKYQDIIEMKSPDLRVLSSQFQGEDGTWTQFMTMEYRRVT